MTGLIVTVSNRGKSLEITLSDPVPFGPCAKGNQEFEAQAVEAVKKVIQGSLKWIADEANKAQPGSANHTESNQ
jgi:hypothetical protein